MFSKEGFLLQFQNLSHPDKAVSQEANQYIIKLQASDDAIRIAREILESNTSRVEHQFIACQLIYRRLKEQTDNSISPYLIQLLDRPLPTIALNQICAAFAVIIVEDPSIWDNILDQLIELMKQKMTIGIEILTQLAVQGKEMFQKSKQIRLQSSLKLQKNKLSHIFKELLKIQDIKIVSSALQSIIFWIQFGFELFSDQQLVSQILELTKQALTNNVLEFASGSFEILTTAIQYSEYCRADPTDVEQTLTELMTFLIQIYNAHLPKQYAILVTRFACDFSQLYLGTDNEWKIFQLLYSITSNPSRSISFQTFEFWAEMQQQKKLKQNGLAILTTIIDKCRVKNTQLTKEFLSGEPEEEIEKDMRGQATLGILDYREHSKDLFYSIFSGLCTVNMSDDYFKTVIQYMQQPQQNQNDYIIQFEGGLFSICSIIDDTRISGDNKYILQIVNMVLQLPIENTEIIVKTALQMFNEFTSQYTIYQDLFGRIVDYILNYMAHNLLGALASAAFEQISTQIDTIDLNILERCITFMEQKFDSFYSESQVDNFISAILNLANKSRQYQIILKLFTIANQKCQMVGQQITEQQFNRNIQLILQTLNWVNMNSEYCTVEIKQWSDQLCASVTVPLLNYVMNFKNKNILDILYRTFRAIINVGNTNQQKEGILMILNVSLQLFQEDPIARCHWLQLLTLSISISQEHSFIDQWITQNIENLHNFIIQQHKTWQDPDLMKYYVEFLKQVYSNKPLYLAQSQYLTIIITEVCQALTRINSYDMQREIFMFLRTYTQNIILDNQNYLNTIPLLIHTVFRGISDFNPALLLHVQYILLNLVRQGIQIQLLEQAMEEALKNGWGKTKTDSQIKIVVRAILSFIKKIENNTPHRELKFLLSKLRPMNEDEINYTQLEALSIKL